jgi:replicative DNA helicase
VAFAHLGCEKNRVDTEHMLGLLAEAGYGVSADENDAAVVVVNTCSFIQDAREESVRTLVELAEQGKELGLIVIDYLQLMEGTTPDNRVQELSRITRGLKGMARELNVPVIALSQLSRGVESRTNKRPMLSDLRESGSIEQDADLVLMIYRDEYYNPETPDRGITEVIVTKHRNGPVGTVKLLFEPQFTRFRNLASP